MSFYVYVLQSRKDKKFYIGFSHDVYRRLKEHNTGKSPSTKYRLPLRLLFFEYYTNKKDAIRREKYFKTTYGKKALRIMLKETLKVIEETSTL
jgi:putative endonuclease